MLLICHHVDLILILDHSFYLSKQNDPTPFLTAAQQYKVSNIPARVRKALEGVVKQYGKLSIRERQDVVFNIILENHMGSFIYIPSKVIINNSISEIPGVL